MSAQGIANFDKLTIAVEDLNAINISSISIEASFRSRASLIEDRRSR